MGFLLLIGAEPVRFLLTGSVLRDIIADMPSAKTLNEMTLLVSAHGPSASNTFANVGWYGIYNPRNML
jgi:hypothetical protein